MTLATVLRAAERRLRAARIDDARIEAELLLAHALGATRTQLYVRLREPLSPADADAFEPLLTRRLAHEPSAYLTGRREFFGLEFACTPAALSPRQETELLVELALAWLRRRLEQGTGNQEQRISPPLLVDVGTGNGAIALSIAVHAPEARIIAIDTSRAALALAQENARAHGVAGRIDFVQASLLGALRGPFDLIVANLPYVPAAAYRRLAPEIREHEPREALLAGRRGTALIEALLASASGGLRPGGLLLAEHAWNQGKRLREAASAAFPRARIETGRDLAGRERVLVVEAAPR
jgi:release factor glutamine methyltransferase